jgi:hypothetical protein
MHWRKHSAIRIAIMAIALPTLAAAALLEDLVPSICGTLRGISGTSGVIPVELAFEETGYPRVSAGVFRDDEQIGDAAVSAESRLSPPQCCYIGYFVLTLSSN